MAEGLGPSPEEMGLSNEGDDDLTPRERREDAIDRKEEIRGQEIRKTLKEPAPINEQLNSREKQKRAKTIVKDSIQTSREPKLKEQSDLARARFVDKIIEEFDSRGWTLPVNRFVVSPVMNESATPHDIERFDLINEVAAWAKEGTDLM